MKRKIIVVVALILAIAGSLIVTAQTTGTTVAEALANGVARDALVAQGRSVGLYCNLTPDFVCKNLTSRAENNLALKEAFQATQAQNVNVRAEIWPWFNAGSVGNGLVEINMLASDKAIIEFLTK